MTRAATGWLGLAWLAFAILPWYALPGDGWLDPGWLRRYPDAATAPALVQGLLHGRLVAPRSRTTASAAASRVPALEGRSARRDRPRARGRVASHGRLSGPGDRPSGLVGRLARALCSALPGPSQAGFGTGRFPAVPGVPRAASATAWPGRGFMKDDAFLASTDRSRGRPGGGLRLLAGPHACSRARSVTTPARSRRRVFIAEAR